MEDRSKGWPASPTPPVFGIELRCCGRQRGERVARVDAHCAIVRLSTSQKTGVKLLKRSIKSGNSGRTEWSLRSEGSIKF